MLTLQSAASLRASIILLSLQTLDLISTTSAEFLYPPPKWPRTADKYKDGDSLNVTWSSAYDDPYLQLYCGQFPPLTNQSVAQDGSKIVDLQTGKRPNCYFRLSQSLSFIASANFSISDDTGPNFNWNFAANPRTTSTNRVTATIQRVTTVTADPVSQTSSAETTPTTSSSVTSSITTSTSSSTSDASTSLSNSAKIGLGVGIPVGFLAIASVFGALWFLLRRKRSHKYQKGDAAVGAFDTKPELDTSVGIEVPRTSNISKHGSTHDLADGPRLDMYELENRPMTQASQFELDAQSPSVATGGGGLTPRMSQQTYYTDTTRPHSHRISGLYD